MPGEQPPRNEQSQRQQSQVLNPVVPQPPVYNKDTFLHDPTFSQIPQRRSLNVVIEQTNQFQQQMSYRSRAYKKSAAEEAKQDIEQNKTLDFHVKRLKQWISFYRGNLDKVTLCIQDLQKKLNLIEDKASEILQDQFFGEQKLTSYVGIQQYVNNIQQRLSQFKNEKCQLQIQNNQKEENACQARNQFGHINLDDLEVEYEEGGEASTILKQNIQKLQQEDRNLISQFKELKKKWSQSIRKILQVQKSIKQVRMISSFDIEAVRRQIGAISQFIK